MHAQAGDDVQTACELVGEQRDVELAFSGLVIGLAACDSQTGDESGLCGVLEPC